MQWTRHGERTVYQSEWVSLSLVDVELPDGTRFEHHAVHSADAAAVVVTAEDRVLLLWRHRILTDTWGWEVPAGRIDPGETPIDAARRETVEETGYEPDALAHLVSFFPTNGISDQRFHVFSSHGATHRGQPSDRHESARVEWVPLDSVPALIANGEMGDGLSLTACLYALAFGMAP